MFCTSLIGIIVCGVGNVILDSNKYSPTAKEVAGMSAPTPAQVEKTQKPIPERWLLGYYKGERK